MADGLDRLTLVEEGLTKAITMWHPMIEADIDPETMKVTLSIDETGGYPPQAYTCDLGHILHSLQIHYNIPKPDAGWRPISGFTAEEKAKLRPICETLAMLAGNAFFGNKASYPEGDGEARRWVDCEWWEQWLPQAYALYENNGGDLGWAGEASFARNN